MKNNILLVFSASLVLFAGCGGTRTNDPLQANADSLSLALEETVNKVILPTVEGFVQKSQQFNDKSADFCSVPSTMKLSQLQQQWKQLSQQWYKLAAYNFGPVNDDIIFPKINFIDSLRQRGIDYTDTVQDEISKDINSATTLDVAYFKNKDFNRVGLLALELLSFETANSEHSKNTQDIVDEYLNKPRKCDLLKGLSAYHLSIANYISSGWQSSYLSTGKSYKSLFLSNSLNNDDKPIPVLITSIQTHLDYLAKRNVATVGAKVSAASYDNIKASLDEIKQVLQGSNDAQASFFDIMNSSGAENSVAIVKDNISSIEQSIQDKNSNQLNANLGLLDGNFKREIPNGLDVELGINFTDGD